MEKSPENIAPPPQAPQNQKLKREFRTLRLSLTENCNLACIYCKSGAGGQSAYRPAQEILANAAPLLCGGGPTIKKVRLTGGEPLLYPELPSLIKEMRALSPNLDIRLTTNGVLLRARLQDLVEAGLDGINVSLDAVDGEIFSRVTGRRRLEKVLSGIEAARGVKRERGGALEVKLNSTMMAGKNASQVIPLLDYAFARGLRLRFIELMKMGPLQKEHASLFYGAPHILKRVEEEYRIEPIEREAGATASYWRATSLKGGPSGTFGIISSHSRSFCRDCDRLRMDSLGNLYGCLTGSGVIKAPLTPQEVLAEAMGHKVERFEESSLEMIKIGG